MPEVALTKQRIEDGKEDRLREWVEEMQNRGEEALETLDDENVYTEAAFIEHDGDDPYLVYFVEAEDIEAAFEAYEHSDHDLDERNREVMEEVLADAAPVSEFEPLYHFRHPDRP